ncbi:hypothetical protein GCM10007377_02000 [Galliscardovia ingluviei]|uniref:Uncharacterized protein n=1 Tax=Galliscardovia ingluviei TaxID=1769422 RepID=A0A8J3EXU9_9BIFI|nr:hypothetical protein GCM10007377_02000 [Galliscardovia ingluviei]
MQGGYKSDQAEDNARDIGNKDRPVLVLLQKGVAAPKGAVEGYIVMTFSDKSNSRYQRYRVLQEAFPILSGVTYLPTKMRLSKGNRSKLKYMQLLYVQYGV